MKAYEILYIVDPTSDEKAQDGVFKRIETTIKQDGGSVDNVDHWGKRELAYEINKLSEGDYTLVNFTADPQAISELDRVCRINDAIVRHMITLRAEQAND